MPQVPNQASQILRNRPYLLKARWTGRIVVQADIHCCCDVLLAGVDLQPLAEALAILNLSLKHHPDGF